MLLTRLITSGCLVSFCGTGIASGLDYPNKPIRIVTAEAGGGNDFVARLITPGLTAGLGQPVIIENRPSGAIPGNIVSKATPDGYTLLVNGLSHWLLPFFQEHLSWDPVRDFSPVALATSSPAILVVHPSLPAKTVKELIAMAKAKPGTLNYASTGSGGPPHLSAELLKAMAGVDIVRIPYKGGGPALNAVIAGNVQLAFAAAGGIVPHLKSGKLRALAITSAQPSALLPGLPTVAASLPGYEMESKQGIFVPAKTPAAIIKQLNQEVVRVLKSADMRDRFLNFGVEPVGSSPEQLAVTVKADMTRLGKLIKDVGIRAD